MGADIRGDGVVRARLYHARGEVVERGEALGTCTHTHTSGLCLPSQRTSLPAAPVGKACK